MLTIGYLQFRQILAGRKIWMLLIFLSIPLALAIVIRAFGQLDRDFEELFSGVLLYILYPQALCILLCLLYGASLISREVEYKTLTYLFCRPIPKWKILISKYASTVICLSGAVTLSLLATWIILGLPGGFRFFLAFWAAAEGAVLVYTALFCTLGVVMPGRAMVVGLLYGVVMEVALSFFPAVINKLTATYYLRSLALGILSDTSREAFTGGEYIRRIVGGEPIYICLIALVVMAGLFLGVSSWIVARKQYVMSEQD